MPSILPPQALPIGLRSMAGSFKSRRRCSPKASSGMNTSRALVAAVPVHEEMRISLERPEEKDLMLRTVVAAVSRRKRISAPSMRTLTTGKTSQRSMGISEVGGGSCADATTHKASEQKKRMAAFEAPRPNMESWMRLPLGSYEIWLENRGWLIMAGREFRSEVVVDCVFVEWMGP